MKATVRLKSAGLAAAMTSGVCGLVWLQRYKLSQCASSNHAEHVMIHMDLNKTMIISDNVQALGLKQSITQYWQTVAALVL